MREAEITKRLLTASELVRSGAVLADIGTDHGYLPIYLILSGKIKRAILSDINEGPLESARANAASSGVSQYVEFSLADGARTLENSGATDYTVLGMGGELIAKIIDEAPQMKNSEINLVLQPMTRPEALRKYLFDSGFSISREVYCIESGRSYVIINAAFSGKAVPYSDVDIYFGEEKTFDLAKSPERDEYIEAARKRLEKIIRGKKAGGECTKREEELLAELLRRIEK